MRKVTYAELRDDLVRHYRTTGKRQEKEYGKRLKHLDSFFARHRAASITSGEITRYVEYRQRQLVRRGDGTATPPANGTINREIAVLLKMLNLARRDRKLVHVPHVELLEEAAARDDFAEPDQFERVRKNLSADLQVVAFLAYTYGMRHGEVLVLDWANVDFEAREIRLRVGSTKNGEGRVLQFTSEVEALLREQRARVAAHVEEFPGRRLPDCVFPMLPGSRVRKPLVGTRRRGFVRAWVSATKAAGVPDLLFHGLRRTAVRNLIRAGVSQQVAQTISGHKTASVFARYNIVSKEDQKDAMAKLAAYHVIAGSSR